MGFGFTDMSDSYTAEINSYHYDKQVERNAKAGKTVERRRKGFFTKLLKRIRKKKMQ